jgi:hypothetical protein
VRGTLTTAKIIELVAGIGPALDYLKRLIVGSRRIGQ